ncbi:hypothetical protein ACQCVB_20305 [Fictibacillus phosphorivorans]|uniref:hypothetical protein n=1 Tax=Fictibacillus phosphorivorans TaxID=1221500 RepID=UPI003CFA975C
MFRRTEIIKFSEFMSGEYNQKGKGRKERINTNKVVLASASVIPLLALTPKVFAAETVNQCGQVLAVSSQSSIPVNVITDGAAKAGEAVGKELIAGLAHLFDPLIDLLIGISFPVASALILFKLFMGFFQDQGQVWEGIGKVTIVYVLIQMFPIFSSILKQLGTLV